MENQSIQDKVSLEVYGIPYNNLTEHYKKQIAPVIEAEIESVKTVDASGIYSCISEVDPLLDFSEIGMARTGGINSVNKSAV